MRKRKPEQVEMYLTVKMPDGQEFQFQAWAAAFRQECVPVTPEIRESLMEPWAAMALEISEAVTRVLPHSLN